MCTAQSLAVVLRSSWPQRPGRPALWEALDPTRDNGQVDLCDLLPLLIAQLHLDLVSLTRLVVVEDSAGQQPRVSLGLASMPSGLPV